MSECGEVVVVGVPPSIPMSDLKTILNNVGKVVDMKDFCVEGFPRKDGRRDVLVTFQNTEDAYIARHISGAKYLDWIVVVMQPDMYRSEVTHEDDKENEENGLGLSLDSFVNFMMGTSQNNKKKMKNNTEECEDKEVVVSTSAGKVVFKKVNKPLPPLPNKQKTSDTLQPL
ncbi:hypothetical protein EIN_267490 [Entamoeba invadens IP1]|uniref:RRM domain-containing protein n=1 Tax=Entamoeba invadens IP1 TaxID=370355 RepID=A0A0A1U809_ENTIV|nr:hypothetical protein EIN_267490 [Entamoeba invadens IP1]ELP91033.1 hypothetical protein EIN_267490 [Entamoeba invadens IP1]|eukprot:XP_004257804.1 hypothetical protein EIN_267490 [Entamoeba invadens IP1]